MSELIQEHPAHVKGEGGTTYIVRIYAQERTDGTWEGWLEFAPDDTSPVLRTKRETTQPNLTDLRYWATGLTPVYLEGALVRALEVPPRARSTAVPETPAYDSPAPDH